MYHSLLTLITLFLTGLHCFLDKGSVDTKYSRKDVMKMYPNLGKNFIMFPDGESGVKIGYLDPPPGSTKILGMGSKVEDDVTFTLYTRDNRNDGFQLKGYKDLPKNFDKTKKTVFVTHGWMSSGKADTCITIKDGYLNKSDANVFIMDWSPIAGNIFYVIPMLKTKEVGQYYSNILNYLINDLGVDPRDLHLVGHSLGAHISGFAARRVIRGRIGRITGLDPALPGFDPSLTLEGRLNTNDSLFVDIIHTCAGFLGETDPIGHADFYPNGGGPPQPGCSILEILEACSHGRSWKLFAESTTLSPPYMATKCQNFGMVQHGDCDGKDVPMGEPTPKHARGVYYIKTTGEKPFLILNT
ncbi:hypothetical protein NQ315_005116 [Exocentrus adspersus]|uniref:Lipase domain-containing protein n=1 Tax=Exocentrus adspersus TaxID=1586481 RepID=A0AAV8VUG9_9CUCU|nr:hypothetical protein NQ315_005116 [Exocentrus adspersus]